MNRITRGLAAVGYAAGSFPLQRPCSSAPDSLLRRRFPAAAAALGGIGRRRRGAVDHGRAFGPNVCVFNDTMRQDSIQSTLNSIASQQVSNQFGTQRYAILFEPGTYGSTTDPLIFPVGYYTTVAGLGRSPGVSS